MGSGEHAADVYENWSIKQYRTQNLMGSLDKPSRGYLFITDERQSEGQDEREKENNSDPSSIY